MTKWIMGVAAVVVVGAGAWWWFMTPHEQPAAPEQPVVTGPDISDSTLAAAAAEINGRMQNTGTATSTEALSAQVAETQATADLLAALALKLSLRLSTLEASSTQTVALMAAFSDLSDQIADMRLQANAALGYIASATASTSTPANTSAKLAKARADMRVAQEDVAAARKDIETILKGLAIALPGAAASTTLQL